MKRKQKLNYNLNRKRVINFISKCWQVNDQIAVLCIINYWINKNKSYILCCILFFLFTCNKVLFLGENLCILKPLTDEMVGRINRESGVQCCYQ